MGRKERVAAVLAKTVAAAAAVAVSKPLVGLALTIPTTVGAAAIVAILSLHQIPCVLRTLAASIGR